MTAALFAGWALRSAALIASGALLLRVFCVRDSRLRMAACIAMLGGSLAMPLLTALAEKQLSSIRVTVPAPTAHGEALWMVDQAALALGDAPFAAPPGVKSIARQHDWGRLALTIYFAVAGLLLLRLCVGLVIAGRLLRRSRVTGRATEGIEILESDDVQGPATLGVTHPVIVLPYDWRDWEESKLRAVLAHERSHILRRDPVLQLISAIHRALLWHSPASWFLHRQIVRVAEEASDDAAVAAVQDPAGYAETLLEFMQRSVRSARWQGVAMARYGKAEARIHRILDGAGPARGVTQRSVAVVFAIGSPLVLLAAAAHLERPSLPVPETTPAPAVSPIAVAGKTAVPHVNARHESPRLSFSRTWIKRAPADEIAGPVRPLSGGEEYQAQNVNLKLMISLMYKVSAQHIVSGKEWLDTDGWDVHAWTGRPRSLDELHTMFQSLLADRFHLKFHRETRPGPVYVLTVDPAGPRMKVSESTERFNYPISRSRDGAVIGARAPMEYFSWWLGEAVLRDGRPVLDKTGLKENYDFTLRFAPRLPPGYPEDKLPAELLQRPSLFDAMRQQLGLQLVAQEGPVEYFVIDSAERPVEDASLGEHR